MSTIKLTGILLILFMQVALSQSAGDAIRIRQNEIGFGARNLAMGGNGVASAMDYSAIYWNPAGLASLKNTQITGEISYLNFSNSATFNSSFSEMDNSFTRFRNIGIALPFPTSRGSLVIAFGYNHVKDFDDYLYFSGFNQISNGLEFKLTDEFGVDQWYPFDRNVTQTEEVISSGGLHQWSAGGAIAVSPTLDLGATVNLWSGSEEYNRDFFQEDAEDYYSVYPADFTSYSVSDHLNTDFKATNLKLGGMLKLNRITRLGLAMEFPTTFTVTENYASSDELVFDDGYVDAIEYEPGTWGYKVRTPYRFDTGIGFFLENVNLTAGATFQDWKQTRFEKPDHADDADYRYLFDENRNIQQNYRETINYHVGGEIMMPGSNLAVRGGYAYYPSPLRDVPSDQNKKVYTAGIGFKLGINTYLDVTYLRSNWLRESEDSYTPGGTTEEISENRLFFGLRFNL